MEHEVASSGLGHCDALIDGVSCVPRWPPIAGFPVVGLTFLEPGSLSAWEVVEFCDGMCVMRRGHELATMSVARVVQKVLSGELVRCDALEVM